MTWPPQMRKPYSPIGIHGTFCLTQEFENACVVTSTLPLNSDPTHPQSCKLNKKSREGGYGRHQRLVNVQVINENEAGIDSIALTKVNSNGKFNSTKVPDGKLLYNDGCMDFTDMTIRHPVCPSKIAKSVSRPLADLDDGEGAKHTKYDAQCAGDGAGFIPLAMNSYGGFGTEFSQHLDNVADHAASSVLCKTVRDDRTRGKFRYHMTQRLAVALYKGNADMCRYAIKLCRRVPGGYAWGQHYQPPKCRRTKGGGNHAAAVRRILRAGLRLSPRANRHMFTNSLSTVLYTPYNDESAMSPREESCTPLPVPNSHEALSPISNVSVAILDAAMDPSLNSPTDSTVPLSPSGRFNSEVISICTALVGMDISASPLGGTPPSTYQPHPSPPSPKLRENNCKFRVSESPPHPNNSTFRIFESSPHSNSDSLSLRCSFSLSDGDSQQSDGNLSSVSAQLNVASPVDKSTDTSVFPSPPHTARSLSSVGSALRAVSSCSDGNGSGSSGCDGGSSSSGSCSGSSSSSGNSSSSSSISDCDSAIDVCGSPLRHLPVLPLYRALDAGGPPLRRLPNLPLFSPSLAAGRTDCPRRRSGWREGSDNPARGEAAQLSCKSVSTRSSARVLSRANSGNVSGPRR